MLWKSAPILGISPPSFLKLLHDTNTTKVIDLGCILFDECTWFFKTVPQLKVNDAELNVNLRYSFTKLSNKNHLRGWRSSPQTSLHRIHAQLYCAHDVNVIIKKSIYFNSSTPFSEHRPPSTTHPPSLTATLTHSASVRPLLTMTHYSLCSKLYCWGLFAVISSLLLL